MSNDRKVLGQKERRVVIYGVTDRRNDSWIQKLNDFLIDHSAIPMKQKSLFFHSLQLLVSSGVEFTKSLSMLATRQRNEHMRRVLDTIVYDMMTGGKSFSVALEKHPTVFSPSDSKVIYAGEISGTIEENLASLSRQISKNMEVQMRVQSALMYPIAVFGAIVLAGAVVMLWVVPKFMVLFKDFPDSELPFSTKVLMGTSAFLQNYWWLLALLCVGGWFLFQNWKKTEVGKREWHGLLLRIPRIKDIVSHIQTIQIASNFSSLMEAGISVEKVLRILSHIVSNSVIGDAMKAVEQETIQGTPLHKAFRNQSILDETLAEVIEVGEQTGNIPVILKKTADQYEMEVDSQLKNINTIIEPVIIIVMGAMVVFMALAILTPILQLQQLFTTM